MPAESLPEGTPPHTPLEVLLAAMRRKWSDGDMDAACALARLAAPYVHGRRAPVREDGAAEDVRGLSDGQLRLLLERDAGTGEG